MGTAVSADDFAWQAWPAATTGDSYITKKDKPNAIEELTGAIARAPFTAGEPIREAKLIKANGAAGYMAAILPSGHARGLDRNLAGNRRRRLHPAERPCRRDPVAARRRTTTEGRRRTAAGQRDDPHQRARARDRPDASRRRTASVSWSARPRRSRSTPRQAETLAQSRQLGTLSLALRSLLDASKYDAVRPPTNRRQDATINTVRFGVNSRNADDARQEHVHDEGDA